MLELKEPLMMVVITGSMTGKLSLRMRAEILSIPGALLDGRFLTTVSTSFSFTE